MNAHLPEHSDLAVTILGPHFQSASSSDSTASSMLDTLNHNADKICELSFVGCFKSPLVAREVLSQLPQMNRLTAISIDECRLGVAGLEAMCQSILKAKHLRRMHVGRSFVPVDALSPLFGQLAYLGHFESFSASELLPAAHIQMMTDILPHLPWLESLHFTDCFFAEDQIHGLGDAAGQCQRLLSFELQNCGLNSACGALLRRGLQQAPVLGHIDVSFNPDMGAKGVADLAGGVQMMHMLHSLKVNHCRSGQSGLDAVAKAIPASRGLRDVELGDSDAVLDVGRLAQAIGQASTAMHPWHGFGITAQATAGMDEILQAINSSPATYMSGEHVPMRLHSTVTQDTHTASGEMLKFLTDHSQGLQELCLDTTKATEYPVEVPQALLDSKALRRLKLGGAAGELALQLPAISCPDDAQLFPYLRSASCSVPASTSPQNILAFGEFLGALPSLEEVELACTSPRLGDAALDGLLGAKGESSRIHTIAVDWEPHVQQTEGSTGAQVATLRCLGGQATANFSASVNSLHANAR